MGRAPGRGIARSLLGWLEQRFNLTEMFSFLTSFGLFPAELDTRRPLRESIDAALRRPLPSYARWPRVLGILSFLLFLFLGLTGAMLSFYYQPTASEAYGSVTGIVRDVRFGWLVHQSHRWAAHLFLLILLVRVARFYFQGLYRKPREALWVLAVLTLLVATHADLTGRLLAWDARGYWTTVRALEVLYSLPILGPAFSYLMGSATVDSLVLTRFYVLHAAALPVMLGILFYLHFSGVRRVGLSPATGETRSGPAVLRVHLYNVVILAVLLFGTVITLAMALPAPFEPPADPLSTPPGIHPPWYLLAPHALLESLPPILPRPVGGLLLELILAAFLLLPFLDRSPWRPARSRRAALALSALAVLAVLLLTLYGYRLEVAR
ncbi:MAG: cytochrome b N-terminal domain-containing protein [Acidobacteriota bacterium]